MLNRHKVDIAWQLFRLYMCLCFLHCLKTPAEKGWKTKKTTKKRRTNWLWPRGVCGQILSIGLLECVWQHNGVTRHNKHSRSQNLARNAKELQFSMAHHMHWLRFVHFWSIYRFSCNTKEITPHSGISSVCTTVVQLCVWQSHTNIHCHSFDLSKWFLSFVWLAARCKVSHHAIHYYTSSFFSFFLFYS